MGARPSFAGDRCAAAHRCDGAQPAGPETVRRPIAGIGPARRGSVRSDSAPIPRRHRESRTRPHSRPTTSSEATMAGPVPLVPLGRPRWPPPPGSSSTGVRHPLRVARAGLQLTGELAAVARGTSTRAPDKGDRRFADPAFAEQPALPPAGPGLPGRHRRGRRHRGPPRARPQERGAGPVRGRPGGRRPRPHQPAHRQPRRPAQGEGHPGEEPAGRGPQPGRRRAPQRGHADDRRPPALRRRRDRRRRHPGAVVFRDEVRELIQYQPATPTVWSRPVVFIPPEISRHYILDLVPRPQPGRAPRQPGPPGVRDQLAQPDRGRAGLEPRHLRRRPLEAAIAAACRITGSPDVHLVGACAGGITAAALAGHLAATGERRDQRPDPARHRPRHVGRDDGVAVPVGVVGGDGRAGLEAQGDPARAGSSAGCSPGCGPTTWCGTTGSTTTCWATTRRPSTCWPGTPTCPT